MSGRYVSPDDASTAREFELAHTDWKFPASFNVAPAQIVPAIRARGGGRECMPMRWGFGRRAASGANHAHSACCETLSSDALFRGVWNEGQRCIIPALGFYAWHANPDGSKQPFYIHLDDQEIFGFAGLWERSCCAIITVAANSLMTGIDNSQARMPALLERDRREAWLSGSTAAAAEALRAYPEDHMIAYPVDPRVDSPSNNDETLLDPLQTDAD